MTASLSLSRSIAAPPGRVWEVLTDLDRASDVLSGVTRVERLTDGPYAVGTRWRETRTMFGREGTEEMWVTEVVPERSTTVNAESHGAAYTTVFTLEPTPTGTDLTMEFGAAFDAGTGVKGLVMGVLGKVGTAASKRAMTRDLDDIATAAESRGDVARS